MSPLSDKTSFPGSPDAELYLRRVLDAIPQLSWRAFPDGAIEFCNRGWLEYTGLTEQQAQGWGWRAAIHPDDLDELVAGWRQVLAAGVPGEAEARMRAADGTFRWFLIRAMPLRDDQGRIVKWYGANIDIDERKRGDQGRRESEERFRLAAQAGKMFAYEWDAATDEIERSEESARILGIDERVPITGQQIFARVHPDDRERLKAAMAELNPENPELQVSYRMVRPDGDAVIWVERNSRAHFDEQGKLLRIVGMVMDVTERKRTEEALRESEERLRVAAEVGRMYAWEWDPTTDSIRRSAECGAILGLDDVAREGVAKDYFNLVHPGDRARLWSLATSLTPEEPIYRTEYRRFRPDGALLWLEESGRATFEKTGKMVRLVGMTADITDRKRTEIALRESEERLRMAAQAGRMYAYEWDVASDVVVRSAESVDLLGPGSPTHTTRQELLNWLHPDDHGLCGDLNAVTQQNPILRARYRIRRQDGTWMWAEKTACAFFDEQGKMVRMIGMIADITERKQAELALSESEERFRRVANTAPVMIWMSDATKLCTYFNQPWLDFTGRSLELELGDGWAEGVHPDDWKRCVDAYHHAFELRQKFTIEYRLRRHDGEYRWILDIGVPRFNADTSFAGYIGSCIDVTDRKLAEESLGTIGRRLIEAHEEERTWLARELHDDVNQSLALLAVELDQLAEAPPESITEVSSRIRWIRERVSELGGNIQALSHRLHSSKLEHLGIAAAAGGFCRELAIQQKVEIDFDCTSTPTNLPPEVSLCLFRVLQETLHNAVKHSGVKLFKVELGAAESEIRLVVRDSGLGFNPEAAMRGSGLGLISMRERARLVGGEISIESQPDRGTTVCFRVPFRSQEYFSKAAG